MVYRSLQLDIYKNTYGIVRSILLHIWYRKKYCLLLKSVTKSWARLKQTPSPKQSMYLNSEF